MAKIIKEFRDAKNFAKVYRVGDEVEFDEKRFKKLVELGLVEVAKAKKEPTKQD